MSFQRTLISGLLLSMLAATTFAYAKTSGSKIPCPAINTIQQAATKIDTAMDYKGAYLVYTSTAAFNESNLPWIVGVKGVAAKTIEEAVAKGKVAVQNTSVRNQEFAIEFQPNLFVCRYGKSDILAIGGMSGVGFAPAIWQQ